MVIDITQANKKAFDKVLNAVHQAGFDLEQPLLINEAARTIEGWDTYGLPLKMPIASNDFSKFLKHVARGNRLTPRTYFMPA